MADSFGGIYKLLWNKYYVDEVYEFTIVKPIKTGSDKLLWRVFDINIIDGIVNGTAKLTAFTSGWMRRIQVGLVQSYALAFVIGIIVILGILIFR
jgi:NADH-quinone oxidoreductase subunit L